MNIRKIMGRWAPHGMMVERARSRFYDDYRAWVRSGQQVSWDTESRFDNIVSVDGFGYTGSGAVVDLLREYACNSVLGYVSPIGSRTRADESVGEVNFLRHTGGLLHLEQAFDPHNISSIYWNDALLKHTMRLFSDSALYSRFASLRPFFYQFLYDVLDLSIDDMRENVFTPILSLFDKRHHLFMLRDLGLDEYRALCRQLLQTLFNHFHNKAQTHLILDQVVSDCRFREEMFAAYLPGFRHIVVYRDPRDVFAIAHRLNVSWIPHDVDEFIRWTKQCYRGFDSESKTYLPICFEDLVQDYDATVSRIESFLGLRAEQHIFKHQNFDPSISVRGIGQWTQMPQLRSECDKIKHAGLGGWQGRYE
ncbi:MAG: sulfotransferase [Bacteroidales bacterium]|nr:sulfotransferase [Candidatus Physcousia equi]